MKLKKSDTKVKTISELAGSDAKGFARFIREKQSVLARMKKDADLRTRQCGERDIVWAA